MNPLTDHDVVDDLDGVAASDTGDPSADDGSPRRVFELFDTGFREVPKRWRKFYRVWEGDDDSLGPNEVICPVCKVVIRSQREYRAGDRVYCMCCFTRMVLVEDEGGTLAAEVVYQ